jgi:hypothetical protein
MGTGWRRALCTSVQRDDHDADAKPKKRRPHDAGAFFSSYSKGSTPALRCRTKPLQEPPEPAPAPMRKPRVPLLEAPSSPRSPSRFALLKASLLPSSKVTFAHTSTPYSSFAADPTFSRLLCLRFAQKKGPIFTLLVRLLFFFLL